MSLKIKICGITNEADGLMAARLGADFLGFVFYPPSPRNVSPERSAAIMAAVRAEFGPAAPLAVGVFVNMEPEPMNRVRERAALDGVQFSGDEPVSWLASQKPLRLRGFSLDTPKRLEEGEAEAFLCDARAPGVYGGGGVPYDYRALEPWTRRFPIMVAGGLTPATVRDVVRLLRPWGVDVSSAVESAPGRKDAAKVERFVQEARMGESRAAESENG
jgi:phosphoribosylanthranilate isomerase